MPPTFIDLFFFLKNKSNTLHMTRCDYDTVFYRVFCVTLLGIAFTFTVILTNVFVDIDGLLSSKKDKPDVNMNPNMFTKFTTELADTEEINYSESEDSYRTKRSIETQSYLFHIKNPKVKNILANRLSTLLEGLESEETLAMKPAVKKNIESQPKVVEKPKLVEEVKKNDEMKHLKLHNTILEGIVNHEDLNEVFKAINSIIPTVKKTQDTKDKIKAEPFETRKKEDKLLQKPTEDRFLNEILNCQELHDQIQHNSPAEPVKESPTITIKTVIDITSLTNDKLQFNGTKIPNENIQGDVQLVYNGKVIKSAHLNSETVLPPQKNPPAHFKLKPKREPTVETITKKHTHDYKIIPKTYMDKFVDEYFKHFPHDIKDANNEINQHFETKRLKRHVRIKYENDSSGEAKKSVKKNTEEDELYVEIETHFDSKGMKGEKKKKIVKNLIEKIQKAIHSDVTSKIATPTKNATKHHKQINYRKRSQNPLIHDKVELDKSNNSPPRPIQRQLHPISKTMHIQEQMPASIDTKSEEWKKPSSGPSFLSNKAINSAEMSELDVNYSKILEVNGIPQRLQQPLNTELSEETIKTNSYYDIGTSKYYVKNIDGSGFSVGFNQYIDNPPDPEAMRIFAGLENMIKSYHQMYDPTPTSVSSTEPNLGDEEIIMEELPYNEHTIERRSIKKHDYHSNEYKVIFEKNRMPFSSYNDIYNSKLIKPKKRVALREKSPLILDENIFDKNLKPSEILSLANLFQRKKRAITKRLKRKPVNRYLNTKAMSKKAIFMNRNRKRNKRQINKIRIIATDIPQDFRQSGNSDDNVFLVSDDEENVFADRAVLKDVETSEADQEKHEEFELFPYQPPQDSDPDSYITNILKRRARQNPLMSKYPHIFMEEISRSGEEFHFPNNVLLPGFGKSNNEDKIEEQQYEFPGFLPPSNETELLKRLQNQEIANISMDSPANSNYKVTVKIIPNNETDVHPGFKEMHTIINKSFNKNGLLYSSLVNVSEISKVMNMNTSTDEVVLENKELGKEESSLSKKIYDQQEKMHNLLKEHAKHISDQLQRLKEEKVSLEYLLNSENTTAFEHFKYDEPIRYEVKVKDVVPFIKTTPAVPINEVQTLIKNNEQRRQLSPITMPVTTTTKATTTTTTTTAVPYTQPTTLANKVPENDIISTIERNGNLTDQILKKIDRNTEILQVFLKKLAERIEAPHTTTAPMPERNDNTLHKDWRNQGVQFPNNMVIRKNDSHISIPFTYSYQTAASIHNQGQSQNIPSKLKPQVANVIYPGLLRNYNHNNKKQHKPKNEMIHKVNETENHSHFFIDGLENDYKVIQLGDLGKNRDFNNNLIHVNDTLS